MSTKTTDDEIIEHTFQKNMPGKMNEMVVEPVDPTNERTGMSVRLDQTSTFKSLRTHRAASHQQKMLW